MTATVYNMMNERKIQGYVVTLRKGKKYRGQGKWGGKALVYRRLTAKE